jgi:splicing factor 3B subunit 1
MSTGRNWKAAEEAKREILESSGTADEHPPMNTNKSIASRENEYMARQRQRALSPSREGGEARSYSEIMRETQLARETQELTRDLEKQQQESKSSRWDKGPRRSRWDQTPAALPADSAKLDTAASGVIEKPASKFSVEDFLPSKAVSAIDAKWQKELDYRNRFLTDEELDSLLPSEGYEILKPPADYKPEFKSKVYKPTEEDQAEEFNIPKEYSGAQNVDLGASELVKAGDNLPLFKPEDVQYFGKLLDGKNEDDMTLEELKERKIMRLLLRIKNGTPQLRKQSLKLIVEKAKEFGAGPLFDKILPLLMSPSLDEQERHLLVKVVDRILYKLDDLVRPYVHKILVVFEPMLIDEDYYARVEGREVISNLAKAAGLAAMISTMRPDIDHVDEFVRNTTARAFAVVASALGIPALLQFIKAVCKSKKSWQARHTGIKIVQQISILMGVAILPYLTDLVDAIKHGLDDEQGKVRTMTALALSALAEAAAPYGYESFQSVLKPLIEGMHKWRGKGLAAFMKAVGMIIPLMEPDHAGSLVIRIMKVVQREFSSPDDEMKKIVLKVVKQMTQIEGIDEELEKMLSPYFRDFWIRRMAMDRRNYKQVVETTWHLAKRMGSLKIVKRLISFLKDDQESFRRMALDCLHVTIEDLGTSEIDERLEELLVDGLVFCYQEIQSDDFFNVLNGIGAIFLSLGQRMRPHLQRICELILWRLNNKSSKVRQEASELIGRLAPVLVVCEEEGLLIQFGKVLYEYLGEEYPEVLASVLVGLKGVVNSVGMQKMEPPIKDLLPRLTPILKNRHEKVQEHSIDLVGKIAEKGHEQVSAREWMRICFELLETLKAPKKSIRRSAILTFGHIARAIGPQDVLVTLLNNLKVQERQLRVCTTIAIAVVADTCSPFTILPALMNEYRVPELNVQNGVLKAMAFMFEYVGEATKDYVYAVTPLFEDALMDRDLIHRQTSCAAVKYLALGCFASDREDALHHLCNLVWPNIFETTAHIHLAYNDAIEGLRVSLGAGILLQYVLQGLFHPARKVRDAYWRIFNSLHYSAQDSLVPFYPRIPNDKENQYERPELYYVF